MSSASAAQRTPASSAEVSSTGFGSSTLDSPFKVSRPVLMVVVTLVGTTLLHAAFAALAVTTVAHHRDKRPPAAVTEMVEIELAKPEPEPPPDEPKVEEPPPPEPPKQIVKMKAPAKATPPPTPSKEAPPPAAAQAGQVLAAADEVVDFGETIVAGKGESFAGGTTESGGTATHAVRDVRARAGGVEGGTGTDLNADRSRAPQLAGGLRWDCPFPPEADDADIDHAVVTLRVEVASSGAVSSARTTADPGYGFGREARRCAEKKRWVPGLDRAGRAINGVALVNLRFDR